MTNLLRSLSIQNLPFPRLVMRSWLIALTLEQVLAIHSSFHIWVYTNYIQMDKVALPTFSYVMISLNRMIENLISLYLSLFMLTHIVRIVFAVEIGDGSFQCNYYCLLINAVFQKFKPKNSNVSWIHNWWLQKTHNGWVKITKRPPGR